VDRKTYLSPYHPTGTRSGTGFAPGGASDPRFSSVLAFRCSCVPEGWWRETKDGGGRDRPEHDVLPQTEGRSTDGGLAASRRGKTLSISLQRMTCGPLRGKTLSVSLQRMTYGPLRGREPVSGGWAKPKPLRLSPS